MAEGRATYKIDVDTRGAQQNLDGLVKGFTPKLEKVSGSINALAGQVGGLGGVAGKTLGTVKQFGEAFLAGGPIGIGLAAGAVAIGKLAEAWQASEEAARLSLEATRETVERVTSEIDQLTKGVEGRIRVLLNVDDAELALDKQREKVSELTSEYNDLIDLGVVRYAQALGIPMRNANEEFDAQLGRIEQRLEDEQMALIGAAEAAEEYRKKRELLKQLEDSRSTTRTTAPPRAARATGGRAATVTATFESVDIEAEQDAAIAARRLKAEEDELNELIAITEAHEANRAETMKRIRMDAEEDVAARRIDLEQQTADEIARIHQGIFSQYTDLAQGAVMSVSSMFFDSLEALAAGQKVSFEEMAAGFIRNVGEQLVAIGVRNVFEGAGYIASGIATSNPQLISGGASLVAAGLAAGSAGAAMAASGAVAQGALSRGGGAGGGGGGGGSARSPVARTSRTSSIGDGDGGQAITIVYNGGTFLGDPSEGARRFERNRRRATANVFVPGVA